MAASIDMVGFRSGKVLVLRRGSPSTTDRTRGNHSPKWFCRCDCGKEFETRAADLRNGKTASCGCVGIDRIRTMKLSHGHARIGQTTRTYRIWGAMRSRCTNPELRAFKNYGGRGITICERWRDYQNFLADMGEAPPDKSIDRINNDGNYEPGNCRWATKLEQASNRRKAKPKALATHCPRGHEFTDENTAWSLNRRRGGRLQRRCRACKTEYMAAWSQERLLQRALVGA